MKTWVSKEMRRGKHKGKLWQQTEDVFLLL
jgi:hypothetical protein